jgi:hypothetical protein
MTEPNGEEKRLKFKGFSKPTAAYRVNKTRMVGGWCMIAVFVVMSLLFLGIPVVLSDEDQLWLLILLVAGFDLLWLGLAVWISMRLAVGGKQRALVYPEGVVIWRDGDPVAYKWKEIASVSRKRENPGPQNRGLVTLAMAGKDLEVVIKFENDDPITLNALLSGLDELAEHLDEMISEEEPEEDEGGAAQEPANPFGNLY